MRVGQTVMNKPFLHLDSVTKQVKNEGDAYQILTAITMTFWQGHTYAIQGASGAGKSSLMHILSGLDSPTKGAVFFNEQNINTMTLAARDHFLQNTIGLLFQQPYLVKELSVLENVMVPALLAGKSYEQCKEDAIELIMAVDLAAKIHHTPGTLSGGQQQRIALARALINKPAFLLADEPTGNLDTVTTKKIVHLIQELHKKWGIGIIICTHDLYVAQSMMTRYVLTNGSLTSHDRQSYKESSW